MPIQTITQWDTGDTIYSGEHETLREAVEHCAREGISLAFANLRRANLLGADLNDAELRRANLLGADLNDANLNGADLNDADLNDADLRRANLNGADLNDADLNGADVQHCRQIISCTLGGYTVYAYHDRSGVCFTAGCRLSLTLAEALAHWSPEHKYLWTEKTSEYGERMTRIVNFLAAEARLLGWPVDEEE